MVTTGDRFQMALKELKDNMANYHMVRAADKERKGATGTFCPGPQLNQNTRNTYSNRTLTLIQQSERYSVDNYTKINC